MSGNDVIVPVGDSVGGDSPVMVRVRVVASHCYGGVVDVVGCVEGIVGGVYVVVVDCVVVSTDVVDYFIVGNVH